MRSDKSSGFENLMSITSKPSWWIVVVLAILSYLFLHRVATAQVHHATQMGQLWGMASQNLIKTLAMFGQYIIPLALLAGAAVSIFSRRRGVTNTAGVRNVTTMFTRMEPKLTRPDSIWDELSPARGREEPSIKPWAWSLELLSSIEWKRFEDLSAEYYREKGIRCETTSLGADGGIDLKLFQNDSGKATTIIQCKAWVGRLVGVKPVRELRGVMASEKIEKGFFMTSSAYSDEAKAFARSNNITLIDATLFLMMIKRLPQEAQDRLLSFATKGDYMTPTCPTCGVKMVRRDGKRGAFWGCRNYPRCKQILNIGRQASN